MGPNVPPHGTVLSGKMILILSFGARLKYSKDKVQVVVVERLDKQVGQKRGLKI